MREATKKDRPKIGTIQAQCILCWRIFASDSICERTKPYARLPEDEGRKGRISERVSCIDPLELGLIARERTDGVIVWGLVDEEEAVRRSVNLAKARTAKARSTKKRIKANPEETWKDGWR